MTVPQDNWLTQRAKACPDRLALRTDTGDLTYAELDGETSELAARLAKAGIRPGDRVALDMPAGQDFAVALHALLRLGAVAVPVGQRLAPAEREAFLARNTCALNLKSLGDLPAAEGGPDDAPLDLEAVICRLETSGTTGTPKPVDLTYGNFLWSAVGSAFNLGIHPADRWLCCLPLNHVGGFSILIRSVIFGTAAIVHDSFDAERVGASLAKDRVTVVSLVATQLARLLAAEIDVSGPRAIVLGGGPLPTDMIAEAEARGARIVQTYGMTEACSQVTTLAPSEAKGRAGSAGRAALGTEVRIAGEEIHIRGPIVAPGHADVDGWLHTGDRGRIDESGFLYVEGRLDDVIVTGGENVMPEEVEAALLQHPDVEDAAVVGRPDPEWQEAVTAVVVLRAGAAEDTEALRAHCGGALAGYKVPKRFEFARRLPRTSSGRLRRDALRQT
ncbi:MAG: AMP-binding protein [Actinomycetota bacterium]|nr:AMP-binding protein [Actinomycetota bacterium]